jgi:pyruvate/2-oxoglutarate/acetoin dehydrogenase E1 component/TPP-dependent pyruvate/acetoin dehydrogenase alpha subunit
MNFHPLFRTFVVKVFSDNIKNVYKMNISYPLTANQQKISIDEFRNFILNDYRLVCESRQASLAGRKEVLTGKAKFGIFGDGKELAQIAMARQFRNGDFRSGYYRDQTFMMAIGELNLQEFFAQLYAHVDVKADPSSAGRQMNAHFATRSLNEDGKWKNLAEMKNSSSDISPTAGQMPRLLGLAHASKIYKENKLLINYASQFGNGSEVAFGTIGDASTSEGLFFETFNAAGVLQIPMVISVWDDGYGISVPQKYQTTGENISDALKGFHRDKDKKGYEIFKVNGWDYPGLCNTYEKAIAICRNEHVPVLIHVTELTQPQGHSTSGSHERYKSKERMQWEAQYDCNFKFREWILNYAYTQNGIPKKLATKEELDIIEKEAAKAVREARKAAWEAYLQPIKTEQNEIIEILNALVKESNNGVFIEKLKNEILAISEPMRRDVISIAKRALRHVRQEKTNAKNELIQWLAFSKKENEEKYNSHLYSESDEAAIKIKEVSPIYSAEASMVDARIILKENFDAVLQKDPRVLVFGEDSGFLGGVNQSLEGLQQKYGELRVFDTGIREATIIGQGIGLALRGLRPIAEIQYLDYLLYALQILSDDLASLHYRTKGGQKAPLIIATRGHRLEGIWHSGSPMGTIIHALRGIYVCVPRNMTKAAGFYNTLLAGDDPGLIIEPLNAYRAKEKLPSNFAEFKTPLGIPEIVQAGNDISIVSYGSTFNLCQVAAEQLQEVGISVELIDIQTLLPFDVNQVIVESIKKTNKVLFVDEDVPGGATAYMMQEVLEKQKAYYHLDSEPRTLTAKAHRPAYASDGDYFSKPSIEDIFDMVYEMMNEANPKKYPALY